MTGDYIKVNTYVQKMKTYIILLALTFHIGYFLKIYRTESKFSQKNVKKPNSYATILNFQPSKVFNISFSQKIQNQIKICGSFKNFQCV